MLICPRDCASVRVQGYWKVVCQMKSGEAGLLRRSMLQLKTTYVRRQHVCRRLYRAIHRDLGRREAARHRVMIHHVGLRCANRREMD